MNSKNQKICLKEFIPGNIIAVKTKNKYKINIVENSNFLFLNYYTNVANQLRKNIGKRKYSLMIPKFINRNLETFEAIGLLQAEMSKVQNGCIQFANHEVEIINQILRWFEKEFDLSRKDWKWYIKVNINEPSNTEYKIQIEKKVINFWLNKTKINKDNSYPKSVSYISKTSNRRLKFYDYGTLIIEHKNNLLSQILKRFVKNISYSILDYNFDEIRSFMRGIIAGESNIEFNKSFGHYRVFISGRNLMKEYYFKNACKN